MTQDLEGRISHYQPHFMKPGNCAPGAGVPLPASCAQELVSVTLHSL